ncbi:MAG: DEAD/DEAH box helicase [Bacteroidia bacterium]|nr:DEAD/DEAH box helicase [Bacteroidia bacterium]
MESFKEAHLKPEILQALDDLHFHKPTPIQAKVLAQFKDELCDCIALAQTGTGKTAAFSIPILNTLNPWDHDIHALVLSPTRELALQISNDIYDLSKYQEDIENVVVYGGASISEQIKALKDHPQIVVGTPGRTKDLINRKKLDLSHVKWLVLDEADEMLSMGFKDDLDYILSHMPEERNVLLFSATLPPEIRKISNKYLKDPLELTVGKKNEGAKNVTHRYYLTDRSNRFRALKRLLDESPNIYSIVFCRTRAETTDVAAKLSREGYNADVLNGDLTQSQRDLVMNKFRDKQVEILVATDVAARGLDVNNLTHVINYRLPDEREAYIHRSGRTGRAGKEGLSYIIIEPGEIRKIKYIEQILGKEIKKTPIPSSQEIIKAKLNNYLNRLESANPEEHNLDEFMPVLEEKFGQLNINEILLKVISLEFDRTFEYYKQAGDLNASPRKSRRDEHPRKGRKAELNYTRYFLNIGTRDKYQKRSLIDLVNKILPAKNVDIGNIEMLKSYSFIELEKGYEDMAIKAFKNTNMKGRRLSLEIAQKEKSKKRKHKRKGKKRR